MQVQLVVSNRHLIFSVSVKSFWLQEDHGVLVPNTGQKQTLSLLTVPRDDHLKPRGVREVGLRTLGVIVASMANSTARGPDSQTSAIPLISASVPVLGCLVDNLIEGWEDVVSELDLGDSCLSNTRQPNSEASNTLLAKRAVEDSVGSVLFVEVF